MTTRIIDRPAARHLTFDGDCRGNLGDVVGPTTAGEYVAVVSEAYNPDTNTTTLGYAYGLDGKDTDTLLQRFLDSHPAAFTKAVTA